MEHKELSHLLANAREIEARIDKELGAQSIEDKLFYSGQYVFDAEDELYFQYGDNWRELSEEELTKHIDEVLSYFHFSVLPVPVCWFCRYDAAENSCLEMCRSCYNSEEENSYVFCAHAQTDFHVTDMDVDGIPVIANNNILRMAELK